MKLIKLIAKNFKILFRARSAATIIILGPLIIMLIAGLAFNNTNPFNLSIGIHSPQQTETAGVFTDSLSEEYVTTLYSTPEDCQNAVRSGRAHACLIYPDDFEIREGKQNEIELFVDTSQSNIVGLIEQSMTTVITGERVKISADLTATLVDAIDTTVQRLREDRNTHLATLLSETGKAKQGLTAIDKETAGLNVTYDPNALTLDGIEIIVQSIDLAAGEVEDEAEEVASQFLDFAEEVLDRNISGSMNNLAQDAIDDAKNSTDDIRANAADISEHRDDMELVLLKAQSELGRLREQLDGAEVQKKGIQKKIVTEQNRLLAISEAASGLESSVNGTLQMLTGIAITNISSIVSPVTVTPRSVVLNASKLNYIFPSLMLLVIMFVSLMLSSAIVITEKLSSARFRILMTPSRPILHLLATVLTVLIVVVVQILIIALIAQYGFGIDVVSNLTTIIFILLLASFIFIFLGVCVAHLFSTEQTSTLGAVSLGSLFLLVSDLILPLESMPSAMQAIVSKTPFVLAADALRQAAIFHSASLEIAPLIGILALYALILLLIILVVQKAARTIFIARQTRPKKPEG
jgi:ABC-type multidrug transport system permease subunit